MIIHSAPDAKQLAAVPLKLSITLTVQQWRDLREQLPNRWPSCDLSMGIYDAIEKIEKALSVFEVKEKQ